MSDKPRYLISIEQIKDGVDLKRKIDELFAKASLLDPDSYRLKTIKIGEADLTRDLIEKINDASFDETEILFEIDSLKKGKASKSDLANYRSKSIAIGLNDLTNDLSEMIKDGYQYDDTEVRNKITQIEKLKADKTELEKYRPKTEKIEETDLSQELANKVNGGGYDDTQIKSDITNLKNLKADKTQLNEYRSKSDLINEGDIDPDIMDKINTPTFDDTEIQKQLTDLDTRSGALKDLHPDINAADLVHAINFVYNLIKANKPIDYGLVTDAVIDRLDYGLTSEIPDKSDDYGEII